MVLFFIAFSVIWTIYAIKEWILRSNCYKPLSYVIVTGHRSFTTNDDIRNVIMNLEVLGTFITQDVNIIQKNIEKFPWIKQVSIRKKWPDTLRMHIVEHIPIAYWKDNYFISTMGVVFKIPNSYVMNQHNNDNIETEYLPILYGPNHKAQEILNNYLIFLELLKSNTFHIKSAKMDKNYSWTLSLTENIDLKLGRENVFDRLSYFIKIYPILVQKMNQQNRYIDYIDLRYRSGCAVKWINNSIIPITLHKK